MRKSLFATAISVSILTTALPLAAQNDVDQQFGVVTFATSCNEVAQRRFNRAMRYQHSFWYDQAKEIFEEVLKGDPSCAMAQWGIALTYLNNPHLAIPSANLAPGLAAIQQAKAMNAKTERERDYIDALALMYIDHDKLTYRERIGAFLKAMDTLAAKYPNDDEAQIAYAITLNASASPTDKTYAQQAKGVALLEPMSKRLPQHPGVTHYLIHLYDYPETAHKGLEAAQRYAKIAPAAPHAEHMPSHIYTRVGYWKELIASNAASAKAARADKEAANQSRGRTTWFMPICNSAKIKALALSLMTWPPLRTLDRVHSPANSGSLLRPHATWWNVAIGQERQGCRSVQVSSPKLWP